MQDKDLSHINTRYTGPAAILGAGANGLALQRKTDPMQFDWLEDATDDRIKNYGDVLAEETTDDEDEIAKSIDGHGYEDVTQLKHIDGDSGPKSYNTSVSGAYQNVTYKRKNGGAIDFQYPENGYVKWNSPVIERGVDLRKGAAKAGHGIRLNGVEEKIEKTDRNQHFSMADRAAGITSASRVSNWTWHHMETPYMMDLVDMMVHRKHGHNGGVHLWNI